jgi:hypothetical protein
LLASALGGCRTAARSGADLDPGRAAALREELLRRRDADQEARSRDYGAMAPEERGAAFAHATGVDRDNTARMKEIVAELGWPTYARVGKEASDAAFLLVQHADHDPEFQAACLPLLEAAMARGEASRPGFAYLTDRVRVRQKRPQIYGTQYHVRELPDGSAVAGKDGRLTYLLPIVESPEDLDAQRAAMGLSPWIEYEHAMAESQGRTPAAAPRAWDGALPVDAQR